MNELPYLHRVQYYETDQMGVVHHSNYIRWLEEARTALLQYHGICYREMEDRGIIIPVVEVSCRYVLSAKYDDVMEIRPKLTLYNGVRMQFSYDICFHHDGKVAATARSSHCFVDKTLRPVALQKAGPEFHRLMTKILEHA